MNRMTLSSFSTLAIIAILATLWQIGGARPGRSLAEPEDPVYVPLIPDPDSETGESLAYPDDKPYLTGLKLDTLLGILRKIRSSIRQSEHTNTLRRHLTDVVDRLKGKYGAAVAAEPAQKRSSDLHDNVQSVLPPWQEFCLMLRMGNCWRYKRSADK